MIEDALSRDIEWEINLRRRIPTKPTLVAPMPLVSSVVRRTLLSRQNDVADRAEVRATRLPRRPFCVVFGEGKDDQRQHRVAMVASSRSSGELPVRPAGCGSSDPEKSGWGP